MPTKVELEILQTPRVVSIGGGKYSITPDTYGKVAEQLESGNYQKALDLVVTTSPKVALRISESAAMTRTRGTGKANVGFETRNVNCVQITSTQAALDSGNGGSASAHIVQGKEPVSRAALEYAKDRAERESNTVGHLLKSAKTMIFGDDDTERITGNRYTPPFPATR